MFKDSEGKLRPVWKIVLILIIRFVLQVFFGFLLGVIFKSTRALYGNVSDDLYVLVYNISNMITGFSSILAVYIMWLCYERRPIKRIYEPVVKTNRLIFLFGAILGLVISVTIGLLICNSLDINILGINFNLSLLGWLLVYALYGISEELLYRGYIITILRQEAGDGLAVAVSASVFTLFYIFKPGINVIGIINVFLTGILMGYIFIKVGLWMSIGFRAAWCYIIYCIFSMNVDSLKIMGLLKTNPVVYNFYSGSSYGFEGSLFTTSFLLIAIVYMRIMTGKEKESN